MTYQTLTDGEMQEMRRDMLRAAERAHYQATLNLKIAEANAETSEDKERALSVVAKAIAQLAQAESNLTTTLSTLV